MHKQKLNILADALDRLDIQAQTTRDLMGIINQETDEPDIEPGQALYVYKRLEILNAVCSDRIYNDYRLFHALINALFKEIHS